MAGGTEGEDEAAVDEQFPRPQPMEEMELFPYYGTPGSLTIALTQERPDGHREIFIRAQVVHKLKGRRTEASYPHGLALDNKEEIEEFKREVQALFDDLWPDLGPVPWTFDDGIQPGTPTAAVPWEEILLGFNIVVSSAKALEIFANLVRRIRDSLRDRDDDDHWGYPEGYL